MRPEWKRPPVSLPWPVNTVDLWRGMFPVNIRDSSYWVKKITDEEIRATDSLVSARIKNNKRSARAMLRQTLSKYLNIPVYDIPLTTNAEGKPQLGGVFEKRDLQFNLTHSGNLFLLAVSAGRRVGIDLEQISESINREQVAGMLFSDMEKKLLGELQGLEETQAFYRCWTRKEAYLKAIGQGLGRINTRDFSVSIQPNGKWVLADYSADQTLCEKWALLPIDAGENYIASLVSEGSGWTAQYFKIVCE